MQESNIGCIKYIYCQYPYSSTPISLGIINTTKVEITSDNKLDDSVYEKFFMKSNALLFNKLPPFFIHSMSQISRECILPIR